MMIRDFYSYMIVFEWFSPNDGFDRAAVLYEADDGHCCTKRQSLPILLESLEQSTVCLPYNRQSYTYLHVILLQVH